ncbi:RNA polymerase sigma factor [Ktedonospora formicarum]|nr:sigma-70 family RNA polymerase sigma factor [Ktedonospora formicarum]
MYNKDSSINEGVPFEEDEFTILTNDLEKLLEAAQPRLTRIALAYGVAPDGVEDVVQETLINAWQHLAHLRMPAHFEAWLNGICRNMSMRWTRTQGTINRRQQPLPSVQESDIESDIPDPQMLDLAEELNRQDLAMLLDRAMNYLPATARKALEMYYIAEMPQREVALQLGMTINALEVRLHRARRQLQGVLNGELRNDAQAFGLPLSSDSLVQGWRETSIWCYICGRRRLQGLFEEQTGGKLVCGCVARIVPQKLVSTLFVLVISSRSLIYAPFAPPLSGCYRLCQPFMRKHLRLAINIVQAVMSLRH